jgi:uncharacterized protein YdhG (YjbR/CyaY superfamily)
VTTYSAAPEVMQYLNGLAEERRAALEALRGLVLTVVPEAVESMRYRMPTYDFRGELLCAFASQKHYLSLYLDTELVEKHRPESAGLDVGKSCIRFRRLEQLPLETVTTILQETVALRSAS